MLLGGSKASCRQEASNGSSLQPTTEKYSEDEDACLKIKTHAFDLKRRKTYGLEVEKTKAHGLEVEKTKTQRLKDE